MIQRSDEQGPVQIDYTNSVYLLEKYTQTISQLHRTYGAMSDQATRFEPIIRKMNRQLARIYVCVFSDIRYIKESEEQLHHLAHHDALTGLPNRLLLNARLEHSLQHARREGTNVAVLFLDLDNFKKINDSMGHPMGDRLLQLVAKRLLASTREEDTVARLGGDELTIVLGSLSDSRLCRNGRSGSPCQFVGIFQARRERCIYVG